LISTVFTSLKRKPIKTQNYGSNELKFCNLQEPSLENQGEADWTKTVIIEGKIGSQGVLQNVWEKIRSEEKRGRDGRGKKSVQNPETQRDSNKRRGRERL
jgi:hypothetical protein